MSNSDNNSDSLGEVEFYLSLNRQQYLKYYQGKIKWVVVRSTCGKKVKFPANLLTSHVNHNGVVGKFLLQYEATGKVRKLLRVG